MPCYCADLSAGRRCAHCRATTTHIYAYRDSLTFAAALSWLHQPWVAGRVCGSCGAREYRSLGKAKKRALSLAAFTGSAITVDGVRYVA